MNALFSIKLAVQGGNYLKIGGARGVPFMETPLETWIILAKDAGCLLFILFGFLGCCSCLFRCFSLLSQHYKVLDIYLEISS